MVTLRDVAVEAGVSPMTVSNAVTGRKAVSPATRDRVMAAVARLGYQPNVAARNLRQGRTGVVGIAVPTLDSQYYSRLAQSLVSSLAGDGLRSVVEVTGSSREGELAAFHDSRHNAYDGLVITALGLSEVELAQLARDLPVVVLGEQELRSVDHVRMPNTEGAEAATTLLLDAGCRRLAIVGSPTTTDRQDADYPERFAFAPRADGFWQALRRRPGAQGVESRAGSSQEAGRLGVAELLDAHGAPDGVFCVTDTLALGVLRGLWERGLRVPDDVMVVGFDDIEPSRFSTPSLSTVSPDHDTLVSEVVRLLTTRMSDPGLAPRESTVPFRVTARESTARAG